MFVSLQTALKTSRSAIFGSLVACCVVPVAAADLRTEANRMIELTWISEKAYSDAFNEVELSAVFRTPEKRELRVPAFWAGGQTWKLRYSSPMVGAHEFRTECSDTSNAKLHGVIGRVEIVPYTGQNPLYRHGPVRVAADHRHFSHADGTPFFWLGDTWWMGLCQRLHWPQDFQTLTADRKQKGFTVVQIVAGLYPDMPAFDPRGANEAGFPWEKDYARIRPEYFDQADRRLQYLADEGLAPCIVGAWGYHLPWLGVDRMKKHWRYLVARYAALPVVWCAAGETTMPFYLAKDKAKDAEFQKRGWTEVCRYIRQVDPFGRPLSLHPSYQVRSRVSVNDPSVLDFELLQTGHGMHEVIAPTASQIRAARQTPPPVPVIDGEPSYENLNGQIPADVCRALFWVCMANGAAGHTYGANGIWQVNRPEQPYGPSPGGNNWGTLPWPEAMRLPGSTQVALGKKLLMQYEWWWFEPHPEWAAMAAETPLKLDDARWIWFPEGNPAQNAPAEKRFFRRSFVVAPGKTIAQARLRVSADDTFTARLNGDTLGSSDDWHTGRQFDNLAQRIKAGTNVVAVVAQNKPTNLPANPAGLIACLEIRFSDGQVLRLVSDADWQCAKAAAPRWDTAGFDDAAWAKASTLTRYGDPPWGSLAIEQDELHGPQAVGIPGVIRVIYVPKSAAVVVRNLGTSSLHAAAWFDPVTGKTAELAEVRADAAGVWTCPPPAGCDHDWVLLLRPAAKQASTPPAHQLTIANDQIAWEFDWTGGRLRSACCENKLSGRRFALSDAEEVSLMFSAALDRVQAPLTQVADFQVRAAQLVSPQHVVFGLRSPALAIDVAAHFQLDGPTRRKWVEVVNHTGKELLLLDVKLDDFATDGTVSGGGQGQPLFLEDELFAAIEHPSGIQQADRGRIGLIHHPGRRLSAGGALRSHTALVSVAKPKKALEHFVAYIQSKALRKPRALAVYTPFGINNQWGGAPTLDDEQTLDVLDMLEKWQKKGVKFDYFTLDVGWADPNSDLTRFRPGVYPNGPGRVVERVNTLGMKFGLWFATSWAAESCWDHPPALGGQPAISMPYRLGYPDRAGEGRMFCFAAEPYYRTLRSAVLHHVRENKVRFLKFDGGSYSCDRTDHGHLPGVYSTERMHDQLIELAAAARAAAPEVFVMWYWGLRSPFWALHGDSIFESGLHMEGSGTSPFPTLYYRDSVTLAQDQNAQFARTIPPLVKDSLGVWLADTRWGNFMGKERWREALVMDLGRGNLLFPNLWGDLYHLTDDDVDFLARMTALARRNEALLLHRRNILGDPFRKEVYGYAHCQGDRGFLFLNNAHFAARQAEVRLDDSIGLDAKPGTSLEVVSHFPDRSRLVQAGARGITAGDSIELWLRPFEVLMLEIKPSIAGVSPLPIRDVTRERASALGMPLALKPSPTDPRLDVWFSDAARFQQQGLTKKACHFETSLPSLAPPQPILAVAVRLRRGGAEWRYSPVVCEIVQPRVRIGDQNVMLVPVPDGRQYGNTQKAGCSWVVYKVRLSPEWARKPLALAVHAWLPQDVEAQVEAWVVGRWWDENARPVGDGYYTDAPS